jgi:hypothetical protein
MGSYNALVAFPHLPHRKRGREQFDDVTSEDERTINEFLQLSLCSDEPLIAKQIFEALQMTRIS